MLETNALCIDFILALYEDLEVRMDKYESVSKSFRTGRLERELQMVQLSPLGAVVPLFVSQSSEFCRHNPLCCFSTSIYCCKCMFCYRLSPETFRYTLVCNF
jgi:hypothetical protein